MSHFNMDPESSEFWHRNDVLSRKDRRRKRARLRAALGDSPSYGTLVTVGIGIALIWLAYLAIIATAVVVGIHYAIKYW